MPTDPSQGSAMVPLALPVLVKVKSGYGHAIAMQYTGAAMIYLIAVPDQGPPVWYGAGEIESAQIPES